MRIFSSGLLYTLLNQLIYYFHTSLCYTSHNGIIIILLCEFTILLRTLKGAIHEHIIKYITFIINQPIFSLILMYNLVHL